MRLLAPLRGRDMALLWSGLTLSALGDQLYLLTLSWVAVGAFGPAAGFLTALQFGVVLLASLGLGGWADRLRPTSGLIGADLVRAAALLALVASWLGTGAPGPAALAATVAVLAVGQAVFAPALQVVLPEAVGVPALLPAANALIDATDRSARLLGPGLIVLLAGAIPPVGFMALDAASFLLSAGAVLLIRRSRTVEPVRRGGVGVWDAVRQGLRAMGRERLLGYVLRTAPLVNGSWYLAFFLALPLLIERAGISGPGGTGLGAFGCVIAAYGSTNLLTTLVLGGRPLPAAPQWRVFGGGIVTGVGTALVGLAPLLPPEARLPGLAAAAALAAIGGPMKDIAFAVLRQTRLPREDLAAAARAYLAATSAGALVAMLLAPALLAALGPGATLGLAGALLALNGVVGLWRHGAAPG